MIIIENSKIENRNKKKKLWIIQSTNWGNSTRENLDMAKKRKPEKKNGISIGISTK